jgi:hypothetical protein
MTKQVIICVDEQTTVLRSLKVELQEAIANDYLSEIAQGGGSIMEYFLVVFSHSSSNPPMKHRVS